MAMKDSRADSSTQVLLVRQLNAAGRGIAAGRAGSRFLHRRLFGGEGGLSGCGKSCRMKGTFPVGSRLTASFARGTSGSTVGTARDGMGCRTVARPAWAPRSLRMSRSRLLNPECGWAQSRQRGVTVRACGKSGQRDHRRGPFAAPERGAERSGMPARRISTAQSAALNWESECLGSWAAQARNQGRCQELALACAEPCLSLPINRSSADKSERYRNA